jgi:DNA-binding NarL/FixJ family response regulator
MILSKFITSKAVLFDDHRLFLDSFSLWLERLYLFQSVHAFNSEKDLLHFFLKERHESVYFFSDFFLKDKNSLNIIADIKKMCPNVHVIIISSLINPVMIRKVLAQKPEAFVGKNVSLNELVACLEKIGDKDSGIYISADVQEIIGTEQDSMPAPFTSREFDILHHIAEGKSSRDIAELLSLSTHTVIAHRRNMMAKINCKSVTQLLAYCRTAGII